MGSIAVYFYSFVLSLALWARQNTAQLVKIYGDTLPKHLIRSIYNAIFFFFSEPLTFVVNYFYQIKGQTSHFIRNDTNQKVLIRIRTKEGYKTFLLAKTLKGPSFFSQLFSKRGKNWSTSIHFSWFKLLVQKSCCS